MPLNRDEYFTAGWELGTFRNDSIVCPRCGRRSNHPVQGVCVECYQRGGPSQTCLQCGKGIGARKKQRKGLCATCYTRQYTPKTVQCRACEETRPHHADGLCSRCYTRRRKQALKGKSE
jgi:NMD protein affecting ribosome stability and mRNA decay